MRQFQEFLSSPWTPSKVWMLVSIPLSVAGIANVVQSFMDLGSLIIYILIFYNKIFDPIVKYIALLFPIRVSEYIIDYFIVFSPIALTWFYFLHGSMMEDVNERHCLKKDLVKLIWRYANIIYIHTFGLVWIFASAPFVILASFVKTPKGVVNEYSIISQRFFIILTIFFILAAFSFGVERWVDPEFLKLQPEHLGIKRP